MRYQYKRQLSSRQRRHLRVRAKVSGTAERPRLNVFRSNVNIYAQIIDDVTGQTLAAASTLEQEVRQRLPEEHPKVQEALIVGQIIGERSRAQGITHVVFDRGGYKYHGRVKAVAEGARGAGLEF